MIYWLYLWSGIYKFDVNPYFYVLEIPLFSTFKWNVFSTVKLGTKLNLWSKHLFVQNNIVNHKISKSLNIRYLILLCYINLQYICPITIRNSNSFINFNMWIMLQLKIPTLTSCPWKTGKLYYLLALLKIWTIFRVEMLNRICVNQR